MERAFPGKNCRAICADPTSADYGLRLEIPDNYTVTVIDDGADLLREVLGEAGAKLTENNREWLKQEIWCTVIEVLDEVFKGEERGDERHILDSDNRTDDSGRPVHEVS